MIMEESAVICFINGKCSLKLWSFSDFISILLDIVALSSQHSTHDCTLLVIWLSYLLPLVYSVDSSSSHPLILVFLCSSQVHISPHFLHSQDLCHIQTSMLMTLKNLSLPSGSLPQVFGLNILTHSNKTKTTFP